MAWTVRVPASAANLGPGFDCFGLALDLCNELVVTPGRASTVRWEGEGASDLPVDGSDLVSRTIRDVASGLGLEVPPHSLDGVNRIPLERGLGSSSSAAVSGVLAASLLLDLGWENDPLTVFASAARIEGHPDNAAPAVFGGFTLALPGGEVHRLDPHPELVPVVIVPPFSLPTAEARAALPERVALEDAVFNAAHSALAVEAFTRDPFLLSSALVDRLHQERRLSLAPELEDVVAELTSLLIPWCVSGAGPSLLAFELGQAPSVDAELLGLSSGWRILRPGVRPNGFEIA
jgi:homoserine kinase